MQRAAIEGHTKAAAERLIALGAKRHLTVCTCSYDTAHESVADQVRQKLIQLAEAFPAAAPVSVSLTIADDSAASRFAAAVDEGRALCQVQHVPVQVLPVPPADGVIGRMVSSKGRALRLAIEAALAGACDAVAYVNLNTKVDARFLACAFVPVILGRADVVVGSRAKKDGGDALGNGRLGAAKSRVWSLIARGALPELHAFPDPNAPLKLMTPRAARLIVDEARVNGLGFDAEWLCTWLHAGLRIEKTPIVWEQRPGSRPPWELIPEMLVTLAQTRRRFARRRVG